MYVLYSYIHIYIYILLRLHRRVPGRRRVAEGGRGLAGVAEGRDGGLYSMVILYQVIHVSLYIYIYIYTHIYQTNIILIVVIIIITLIPQ